MGLIEYKSILRYNFRSLAYLEHGDGKDLLASFRNVILWAGIGVQYFQTSIKIDNLMFYVYFLVYEIRRLTMALQWFLP